MEPTKKEKPKAILEDIDVFEVSFVPKAANKRKFLMFKADESSDPEDATNNGGTDSITHKEELNMSELILKALEGELQDAEKVEAAFKEAKVSEGGAEALTAIMKILTAFKEDLPEADQIPVLLGYPLPEPTVVEKVVEKIVEVEKKEASKTEEVKKAEMLEKVEDETARAEIEKLWEDRKALAEKQAELETTLKAEKEAKELKEAVDKAEKMFPNLPATAEEIGTALRMVEKSAENGQYELIERLFVAANEAIAKQKEELGGPGGNSPSGDTYKELAKKAAEMVEKGEAATTASAITILVNKDPSKYDEYAQGR